MNRKFNFGSRGHKLLPYYWTGPGWFSEPLPCCFSMHVFSCKLWFGDHILEICSLSHEDTAPKIVSCLWFSGLMSSWSLLINLIACAFAVMPIAAIRSVMNHLSFPGNVLESSAELSPAHLVSSCPKYGICLCCDPWLESITEFRTELLWA